MQEHAAGHRTGPPYLERFLHADFFMKRRCAARARLFISGVLATFALSEWNVMAGDKPVRRGNQVHHPLRHTCSGVLVALILVAAICAAPPAHAEIFKCVAKDATALYQNFPCEFDSIGWMPSNPQAAKTTLLSAAASQATPKAAPVNVALPLNVASTVKSTYTGEPRIGMTADEVTALLGEPVDVVEDEPGNGGRVSIWRYADGMTIQFDHKHHGLGVQR